MAYMVMLILLMVLTVVYLMIGGISLLKSDEVEQKQIDKEVRAALLK